MHTVLILTMLWLIHGYLTNRKLRTKLNTKYSSQERILFGVPQVLSQNLSTQNLLFNIFFSDIFVIMNKTTFASYADDNTLLFRSELITLRNDSVLLFK